MSLSYEDLSGAAKTSKKRGRLQERVNRIFPLIILMAAAKILAKEGGEQELKKGGYRNMGQKCLIGLRKKGGESETMT